MGTTEHLTYTVAETAKKLRVSPDMVYMRVQEREWPCTRLGRKIHFTPQQIEEIIKICAQPALTRAPRRRAS